MNTQTYKQFLRSGQNEITDEKYWQAIELLAANKKDWSFPVVPSVNAEMVLAKIFEHSNEEVRIYDESLENIFGYASFKPSLRNLLINGKSVRMVVKDKNISEEIQEDLSFYNEIYPQQIDIRHNESGLFTNVSSETIKKMTIKAFITNDIGAYKIDIKDPPKYDGLLIGETGISLCNFNGQDKANILRTEFYRQYGYYQKISLVN